MLTGPRVPTRTGTSLPAVLLGPAHTTAVPAQSHYSLYPKFSLEVKQACS